MLSAFVESGWSLFWVIIQVLEIQPGCDGLGSHSIKASINGAYFPPLCFPYLGD